MPQKNLIRWKLPTAVLASAGLVLAILLGGAVGPAQAAVPATQVTKLFDAYPYVPIPAGSFFPKSVDFKTDLEAPVLLSANPDGTGSVFNYDAIQVDVNGVNIYNHNFRTSCSAPALPTPPIDLLPYLHSTAISHLTVRLVDNCGYVGSTPIYLVVGPSGSKPPYAPPVPPPPPSAITCGTANFFGVRGSGETANDGGGYGNTILALYADLIGPVPGIQGNPIDYPAIPVRWYDSTYRADYAKSVSTGVTNLEATLRLFFKQCPGRYAILGGFSQGAQVVETAFLDLSATEKGYISSVVMFGNPLFNPKDYSIDMGDYPSALNGAAFHSPLAGLWQPTTISSAWSQKFESYCTLGDPVCSFSPINLPGCANVNVVTCPHVQYDLRGWVNNSTTGVISNLKIHHAI